MLSFVQRLLRAARRDSREYNKGRRAKWPPPLRSLCRLPTADC